MEREHGVPTVNGSGVNGVQGDTPVRVYWGL